MRIKNKIPYVVDKHILLFQGPMGSFFNHLDRYFQDNKAFTYRVGLNGADWFFSSKDHYTPFYDKKEYFETFILNYYQSNKIDMIFLFGDCRYYQSIAIKVAKRLDIEVYVFEEGYIRPYFITLENDGVNNNSTISRDREFYENIIIDDIVEVDKTYNSFFKMAYESTLYYVVAYLLKYRYPNYMHHRDFSPFKEFCIATKNIYRKFKYKFLEYNQLNNYEIKLKKRYFFVPLQTAGDFQIIKHSKYNSIEEFIEEVIESFSKYSLQSDYLVIKHHPMDRGRYNYKGYIKDISKKYNCKNRIKVVYDIHLPTLLINAKGTIVVNSTVGLSSLYHHTPTICLGDAIYDIDGLTSKSLTLKQFWQDQLKVDKILLNKYRYFLIKNTQINLSFYSWRFNI